MLPGQADCVRACGRVRGMRGVRGCEGGESEKNRVGVIISVDGQRKRQRIEACHVVAVSAVATGQKWNSIGYLKATEH